jgi:hypothetical protein
VDAVCCCLIIKIMSPLLNGEVSSRSHQSIDNIFGDHLLQLLDNREPSHPEPTAMTITEATTVDKVLSSKRQVLSSCRKPDVAQDLGHVLLVDTSLS